MAWANTDEADLRTVDLKKRFPRLELIYDSSIFGEEQAIQKWVELLLPLNHFTKQHGVALGVAVIEEEHGNPRDTV